jgi:hypothetical protein
VMCRALLVGGAEAIRAAAAVNAARATRVTLPAGLPPITGS